MEKKTFLGTASLIYFFVYCSNLSTFFNLNWILLLGNGLRGKPDVLVYYDTRYSLLNQFIHIRTADWARLLEFRVEVINMIEWWSIVTMIQWIETRFRWPILKDNGNAWLNWPTSLVYRLLFGYLSLLRCLYTLT